MQNSFTKYYSTINQLMTAMVLLVGVHLVFSGGLSAGILAGFYVGR